MIQHIIVFFIVGLAVGFLIRHLYRKIKGRDICDCGCAGCADAPACASQNKTHWSGDPPNGPSSIHD